MVKVIAVSVSDMPEVILALRRKMAEMLLEAAQDEGPEVVKFATRVAAAFEVGVEETR